MNAPLVSLHALRCEVQGRTVLHIDKLCVHAGERVAVVGPNGAGKSTLLKVISGLFPAVQGEVQVINTRLHARMPGQDLRQVRAKVGHLWQGLYLVGRLSALDNVLIGALGRISGWRSWLRVYTAQDQALARQALARVGAADLAEVRCDRLSGGERQKVAMARLLMQNPQLVLADEPTAALDPAAAEQSCALLLKAAQQATLITVVHNTALLPLLADRVLGLRQGRVVFDLPTSQVNDMVLNQLYQTPTTL